MPRPPLIAIVDDDEGVREALADLLQVAGFATRCFADAEAFLGETPPAEYDSIVSDVRMAGIDGVELQRRLRARGSKTPFLFITSHHDPVTRRRALACGAHAFLSKPVSGEILLAHLEAALGRKAAPGGRKA